MHKQDNMDFKENFSESLKVFKVGTFDFENNKPSGSDDSLGFSVTETWQNVFIENMRIYSTISDELLKIDEDDDDKKDEKTTEEIINAYDESIECVQMNIIKLKNLQLVDNQAEWERFIDKIMDHVDLIRIQMNRIYDTSAISGKLVDKGLEAFTESTAEQNQQFNEILKQQEDRLSAQQAKSEALETEQLEIINSSKNIQKEFIAILGIFAAILIAAFGGLTSLTSLFKKINEVATYKLLFLGAFEVLAILMILFLMLNGVAKLTGLNLRSCGCEQDCSCKIHKKHPTLFMLTILTLLLSFISLAPLISKFFNNWSTDNSSLVTFSVYFLVVLVTVITIIFTWFEVHSQEVIKKESTEVIKKESTEETKED